MRAAPARLRAAAAWIGAAWLGGCGPAPAPSFVLVVVDTLRADHLHHAGFAHAVSPQLDALAARSVRFDNAHATAPWTLPSLASLLVSQLPSEHRVAVWGARLAEERLSVVEILADAGYRTAAFTANVLVGPASGFAQGFEVYQVVAPPRPAADGNAEPVPNASAEQLSARALAWLDAVRAETPDAPVFLYLHYMEPHTPYRCRPGAAARCRERAGQLYARLIAEQWDFDPGERDGIRALYRAEVRRIDAALGRLRSALARRDPERRTWLLVTADHGEQLGERGAYLHGLSLDRREMQVPLLVSGPGAVPRRVDAPVSLLDVAPTVLELAGLPAPAGFRGRSLAPALRGGPLPDAPAIAEALRTTEAPPRHRLAVVRAGEKLLLGYDGRVSRVDPAGDPDEEHPEPVPRAALSRALGEHEAWIDWSHVPAAPELDPAARERLRALGYEWR